MKPSRVVPLTAVGPLKARVLRLGPCWPATQGSAPEAPATNGKAPDSIIGGRDSCRERIVYPLVRCSLVAVYTTGVDLEQDVDAVTRSPGDLGSGNPGVEPQRHSRVTKVVRPSSKRRLGLSRGQAEPTRLLPHQPVRRSADRSSAGGSKEPPASTDTERNEESPQHD